MGREVIPLDNTLTILEQIVAHWPALAIEVTALAPLLVAVYMVCNGLKCLMRSDMLAFVDEIDCSDLFPEDPRERILCFELI